MPAFWSACLIGESAVALGGCLGRTSGPPRAEPDGSPGNQSIAGR